MAAFLNRHMIKSVNTRHYGVHSLGEYCKDVTERAIREVGDRVMERLTPEIFKATRDLILKTFEEVRFAPVCDVELDNINLDDVDWDSYELHVALQVAFRPLGIYLEFTRERDSIVQCAFVAPPPPDDARMHAVYQRCAVNIPFHVMEELLEDLYYSMGTDELLAGKLYLLPDALVTRCKTDEYFKKHYVLGKEGVYTTIRMSYANFEVQALKKQKMGT
jgi:hypothetical protein